jgi:hypothetical protein
LIWLKIMKKSRSQYWNGLLFLLLFFNVSGCAEKANTENLKQGRDITWDILSGDGQVGFPRVSFADKVLVQVRDFNGRPLPGVRIYPHLVDIGPTSSDIRPDWSALAEAARAGLASTDPSTQDLVTNGVLVPEEAVGRIGGSEHSTDDQGRASFRVWAPLRYGRTIALLLSLKPLPDAVHREGIVILRSRDSAEGSQFILATSAGDAFAAATPFDLSIRFTDRAGNVDATLEGELSFTLSHNANRSFTGMGPQLPNTFTCVFIAGTCAVPGGPFLLPAAQDLLLELNPEVEAYEAVAKTIRVTTGPPVSISIARKAVDGTLSAISRLDILIGESADLEALYVDLGGNIVGNPDGALWTASDPYLQQDLPQPGTSSFSYAPQAAGSGEIAVEADLARTIRPLIVNIPHGPLAEWLVKPSDDPPYTAGECTKLSVTGRDKNGNTVTALSGTVDIQLSLMGHISEKPTFYQTHLRLGDVKADTLTLPVLLTAGSALLPAELCTHTAVNNGASLNTTASGISSALPFQVEAGPPATLLLADASSAAGPRSLCSDHTDTRNIEKPCVNFSADDPAFDAAVFITDSSGNVLSPGAPSTRISVTGPLGQPGAVGSLITQNSSPPTIRFNPTRSGDGLITLTQDSELITRYAYQVSPGVRTTLHMSITQNGRASPLSVDAPLDVSLAWHDQHGNVDTAYNGTENVQLELSPADISPSGEPPAALYSDLVVFSRGEAVLPAALAATAAPASPAITATTSLGSFTSDAFNIVPGAVHSMEARDSSGSAGNTLSDPIHLDVFDSLVVYAAGLDKYKNYIRDLQASYTGTNTNTYITEYLSQSSGFSTQFQPREPGIGSISLTFTDKTAGVLTAETGTITVTARQATAFLINTTNDLEESAGQPFTFIIDAVDSEGYRDITFNQTLNLETSVLSQPSWRAVPPTLPTGVVTCSFVEGRCELKPPAGPGWIITDSRQASALTIQDLSGSIPRAWTALIDTSPGEPYEVLIADLPGGPDAGATIYDSSAVVRLTTDESISFASSVVDQSGNWLYDVNSTWTSNLSKISSALTQTAGSTTTYDPVEKVLIGENGEIQAAYLSTSGETLTKSLRVITNHGVPTRIRITLEGQPGPTIESGVCAPLSIEVVDAENNVADSYNLITTLRIGAKGLQAPDLEYPFNSLRSYAIAPGIYCKDISPVHVHSMADLDPSFIDATYSVAPYKDFDWVQGAVFQNSIFSTGKLATDFRFCSGQVGADLRSQIDAEVPAESLPDFGLDFNALTGSSVSFETVHSAPKLIGLVLLDKHGSQVHYCAHGANSSQTLNSANNSLNHDQANDTSNITCSNTNQAYSQADLLVDDHFTIRPVLLDRGGLYLKDAVGVWETIELPATESSTPVADSRLQFTGRSGSAAPGGELLGMAPRYTFRFRYDASGTAQPDDAANGIRSAIYKLALAAREADSLILKASDSVRADRTFQLEFTLLDRYGNLTLLDTSLSKQAAVTQTAGPIPLDAPNGSVAALPPIGTVQFYRESPTIPYFVSAQTFQLPRAEQTMTFRAEASVSSTNIASTIVISPQPGPAADHTLAYHESGQPVADTDGDGHIVHNLVSDGSYYLVATDALGNPFTSEIFDLSATGDLNGWISKTEGTNSFQFLMPLSGSGDLTVTPRNGNLLPRTYTFEVVDGEPSSVEVALEFAGEKVANPQLGVSYDVRLTVRDKDSRRIASMNGDHSVVLQLNGNTATIEDYIDTLTLPESNLISFTQGVSDPGQITLTVYAASVASGKGLLTIFNPGNNQKSFLTSLPEFPTGNFHHFGVSLANPTPGAKTHTYIASLVPQSTFDLRVQWRDQYGNPTTEGPNGPVSLSVVRDEDGSPTLNGLLGTGTTNVTVTDAAGTTISGLSFAPPGQFRIQTSASGVSSSPLTASPLLVGTPTTASVAGYDLRASGQASFTKMAGSSFILEVVARDLEGRILSNIDQGLSTLTFSQVGLLQAPNGTEPGLLAAPFSEGRAYFIVTPNRVQTLSSGDFTISDNQGRSGALQEELIVAPNLPADYVLIPTDTIRTADRSASGLFDVGIQIKDTYGNLTPGDPGLRLALQWTGAKSGHDLLFISNDPNGDYPDPLDTSNSTGTTATGYYSPSPGTAELVLVDQQSNVMPSTQRPSMTFTATESTIQEYRIFISGSTITAGNQNLTLTVMARDGSEQTILGFDQTLTDRAFTLIGASTSPNGQAPVIESRTPFSDGVSTFVVSLYAAETIPSYDLVLHDNGTTRLYNHSFTSFNGPGVAGAVESNITVQPAQANTLGISYNPSGSLAAGGSLTAAVLAKDAFGNPTDRSTSGDACGALDVQYESGPMTSPGAPGTTASLVLPSTEENSKLGTGSHLTGAIRPYAAGLYSFRFNICGLTASADKNVSAGAVEHLQIKTTDTAAATPVSITQRGHEPVVGSPIECPHTTPASPDVACPALYAWAFDTYGNQVSTPSTCQWTYENSGTSTGASTPTAPTAAAHSWAASSTSFLDGRITCTTGGVESHVDVWGGTHSVSAVASQSFPLTAGSDNLGVSLTLMQSKNNNIIPRSSATTSTVSLATTSLQSFGTETGALGQNQTSSVNFSNGVSGQLLFDLTRAQSDTSITFTVHGKQGSINGINVIPAAASKVVADTTSATAGVAFNVTATVQDAFGNTVTSAANCGSLTLSAPSSPGGYNGVGSTAATLPSPVVASSPGVYGPFSVTLYRTAAPNSVSFSVSGCNGTGVSTSIPYTVAPGDLNAIYLSQTNAVPASGSQLTSLSCTSGTSVTCGPLYAFGFDIYGNNIHGNSFQCGSWSFTPTTGSTGWTGDAVNSHSTTVSHSTSHIDGTLTCTSGAISHSVAMQGSITRTPQFSCGNWSCNNGDAAATCTVTNTTGYSASYFDITSVHPELKTA